MPWSLSTTFIVTLRASWTCRLCAIRSTRPTLCMGDHPLIPWSFLKSQQQTAPIGVTLPTGEYIEVTDPTHPLYGLTLPCLSVTVKQRLGRVCVVWLAPGIERLIPLASTSL